jgi:hypothetical protein
MVQREESFDAQMIGAQDSLVHLLPVFVEFIDGLRHGSSIQIVSLEATG